MNPANRAYAKSLIMKGLESSDYSSSSSSDDNDVVILPRKPSIQFEDYQDDDVTFVGIKKQSAVQRLLENWDKLYKSN